MPNSAHNPLLVLATLLPLAACGDPAALDGGCFDLQQAQIALNSTQLQGVSLNGIQSNGIQANGVSLNGVSLNGVSLNGASLDGASLDRRSLVAVRLDGGRLVAERGGVRLPDDAFVGASLGDDVRITSVTVDDVDERLAFYGLEVIGGASVCGDDGAGVFVAGSFDTRGAYAHDASGATVSYACASGVMNKCVQWGYRPWSAGADAYQTCTRMARADYCGDGVAWTQDGTPIDMYDGFGVQQRAGGMDFEAGWGVDGAVCVAAPRYDIYDASGAAVRPPCWDTLPRCASLERAEELGAIIANDSGHTAIAACGG